MAEPKTPTKDEFVQKHRHEIFGMICDALVTDAKGGELSLRMRANANRVDTILRQIYDEFIPPNRPALNTPAAPPVSKAGPVPASPLGGR